MVKFKVISEFTVIETLYIEAENMEQAREQAQESNYNFDISELGDRNIIGISIIEGGI